MPLAGQVIGAPAGVHGFDCNTVLTPATAAALRNAGFMFCIRYLSRGAIPSTGDLTTAEADLILDAGLSLMAVQHVANPGWLPTAALGASGGAHAAGHAHAIGIPAGVNIWLDLEGVAHAAPAENVIDYCNAWFEEVETAGLKPVSMSGRMPSCRVTSSIGA